MRRHSARTVTAGVSLVVAACSAGHSAGRGADGDTSAAQTSPAALAKLHAGAPQSNVPVHPPDAQQPRPHRDVPGGDAVSPEMRQWTPGAVDSVLQRAGARGVRAAGTVRQPFLAVPGTRFTFADGELQAYVYGDAGARGRDTDVLDSARAAPATMQVQWRLPPTLITNNNLAVILLTRDAGLRDRVAQYLTVHDRDTGAAEALPHSPRLPQR